MDVFTAGADGGRRELRGHDRAVHRTKRPEDRNAIAVVDRDNARPHETAHGAPEDVEKQPATEFRVL